jgi:magnesium transporter
MRVWRIGADGVAELAALPEALPDAAFLWIACTRPQFEQRAAELQAALQRWSVGQLLEPHVADLLNPQLQSHFDYTSRYDLMVFRRLAAGNGNQALADAEAAQTLAEVDTSPIGFAVLDRVLITVHPELCPVFAYYEQRLPQLGPGRGRLPTSPADLMLRMVNHIVDSYLELRRLLTRQLVALQQRLLGPKSRFHDWQVLLDARNALHLLEDTCEDQRAAVQEWIDGLAEWPAAAEPREVRDREVLRVRSRDVLEHIERVLTHVRGLERSIESAVQIHFAAQSQRTSDIMRTLTVLTAIFLPLNLITGFFGMNFEALPLIHRATGVWITVATMALVGLGLVLFFWRKRYLGTYGSAKPSPAKI